MQVPRQHLESRGNEGWEIKGLRYAIAYWEEDLRCLKSRDRLGVGEGWLQATVASKLRCATVATACKFVKRPLDQQVPSKRSACKCTYAPAGIDPESTTKQDSHITCFLLCNWPFCGQIPSVDVASDAQAMIGGYDKLLRCPWGELVPRSSAQRVASGQLPLYLTVHIAESKQRTTSPDWVRAVGKDAERGVRSAGSIAVGSAAWLCEPAAEGGKRFSPFAVDSS